VPGLPEFGSMCSPRPVIALSVSTYMALSGWIASHHSRLRTLLAQNAATNVCVAMLSGSGFDVS
jgi:hypothetical protein